MISKLHTHTESKRLLLSYISGEKCLRGIALKKKARQKTLHSTRVVTPDDKSDP